jgi:hypothetical protein
VIGLDEFEVIAKLFPCDFAIIILIVCVLEEELDILVGDFGVDRENKKEKKSEEIKKMRYLGHGKLDDVKK